MRQGWEIKKLGELCDVKTGKANTEDAENEGVFAFFDRSKNIKRSNKFLFDCEALIMAGEGQTFFPKYYSGKFNLHQRAYALFNFKDFVDIKYNSVGFKHDIAREKPYYMLSNEALITVYKD